MSDTSPRRGAVRECAAGVCVCVCLVCVELRAPPRGVSCLHAAPGRAQAYGRGRARGRVRACRRHRWAGCSGVRSLSANLSIHSHTATVVAERVRYLPTSLYIHIQQPANLSKFTYLPANLSRFTYLPANLSRFTYRALYRCTYRARWLAANLSRDYQYYVWVCIH
jgi:hypothetical protein